MEALDLGRLVLHRSGEEGIDELWGEPFRLFSTSLEQFFEGRYIKIGLAMKDIDAIANCIVTNFGDIPVFAAINRIALEFAAAARVKIETLRTDPEIFDVWAQFVAAGERLANFSPVSARDETELKSSARPHGISDGVQLLRNGHALMFHITRARTSMPKSTREFIERCEFYRLNGRCPQVPLPGGH